jgi:hypothetical protein
MRATQEHADVYVAVSGHMRGEGDGFWRSVFLMSQPKFRGNWRRMLVAGKAAIEIRIRPQSGQEGSEGSKREGARPARFLAHAITQIIQGRERGFINDAAHGLKASGRVRAACVMVMVPIDVPVKSMGFPGHCFCR